MTYDTSPGTVVGVFDTHAQAQEALGELRRAGFRDDQMGVLSRTAADGAAAEGHDPTHTRWEEGSGIGAAVGAVTGTGLGVAVAAGLIPGVGPVIAGGMLAALLASAGAGAGVGTVIGALIGLGIPEDESRHYEGEFASGRTLVTVRAENRSEEARNILNRFGAHERATVPAYGGDLLATPY